MYQIKTCGFENKRTKDTAEKLEPRVRGKEIELEDEKVEEVSEVEGIEGGERGLKWRMSELNARCVNDCMRLVQCCLIAMT